MKPPAMKGSKRLFQFLVLTAAMFAAAPESVRDTPPPLPAMNLDAIHPIYCPDWMGSGFMIAPRTMVTAYHVLEDGCMDMVTGKRLMTYKRDKAHDLGMMTEDADQYGGYLHYNCQKPVPGHVYISYGYSPVGLPDFFHPILRSNAMEATKQLFVGKDEITGSTSDALVRFYNWAGVEGTSGGPVADDFGNVVAINNAGDNETSVNYDLADTGLCTGKWD